MGLFDQIILLLTGLVAIYLIWRFFGDYRRQTGKPRHDVYYMLAFTVLLVAGLLLIAFGYQVLQSPLVVIVAVLIPAGLALGLVTEFLPRFEKAFLTFAVIGLAAVAITRFSGPPGLATAALIVVHAVSGLLIFGLPLWAAGRELAPRGFAMVTVGGTLIGIGGLALAFLKAGLPILPAEFIFAILAPLLLLTTGSFAIGFVKGGI